MNDYLKSAQPYKQTKKSTYLMDFRAGEKFSGWALSERKGPN